MVEWISSSGLFNEPCNVCGVLRLEHQDHEAAGHWWYSALYATHDETEYMTMLKTLEREERGEYDAPLPPPAERRRIREAAGWTQQQVADALHVSRHTVGRFERKAGLIDGHRLPGREPSGDVRVAYSELLTALLNLEG